MWEPMIMGVEGPHDRRRRWLPLLVLGPRPRYVDETTATVWVETGRACQVEILA
jgi:hypothetical protein